VEAKHDERGIIWPKSVAPYHVVLVSLTSKKDEVRERIESTSDELYEGLRKAASKCSGTSGRREPWREIRRRDLLGIPLRIVISEKNLAEDSVEWRLRGEEASSLVKIDEAQGKIEDWVRG